jgi:hypothetical protein
MMKIQQASEADKFTIKFFERLETVEFDMMLYVSRFRNVLPPIFQLMAFHYRIYPGVLYQFSFYLFQPIV